MRGGEAEVLRQSASAKSLETWRELLQELSERNPDEISVDECYGLVDELDRVLRSKNDTMAELVEACEAIAEVFMKFRGSLEYSAILEHMLDRVCMVPGGHVKLGALLEAIKIEIKSDDAHAYLALDVVRVALQRLYLRKDVLWESRSKIMGVCYDAMLRVALRNGLHNLADIMRGSVAREEFCGPKSEICRMAMLRISIYDKRDVPSDGEIVKVLRRYPALSGMLDPGRVIESKWRLTRLIHHISLDHLVGHEDYGWAYTAMAESNIRIRYWLDRIYRQHGISNGSEQDGPGAVTRKPPLAPTNILVSVRYLALEIYDFWELYQKSHEVSQGQEISDVSGIYRIVEKYKDSKNMQILHKRFGARPRWTLGEASRHIGHIGLDKFVFYAHLVLMFQDAVYRTIPSRHRRDRVRGLQQAQVSVSFEPVTAEEKKKSKEEYSDVSVVFGTPKRQDAYMAMHESLLCMRLLVTNFNEGSRHLAENTLEGYLRFSNEVYNVRYMILELANFIKQYDEMGLKMKSGKSSFMPKFLKRKELYRQLRNRHATHVLIGGVRDIQGAIEENPDLISGILRDVMEAGSLVTRLSREFEGYAEFDMRAMTHMETQLIERKLDRIRAESSGRYGNELVDPDQKLTMQRRKEEVKHTLGIK